MSNNYDNRELDIRELDLVIGGGNSIKAAPSENHLSSSPLNGLAVTIPMYIVGAVMIALGVVG